MPDHLRAMITLTAATSMDPDSAINTSLSTFRGWFGRFSPRRSAAHDDGSTYLIRAIVTDALKIMINTLKIVMAEIERRGLCGSCCITCCAGLRSLYQSLSYMLMKKSF